MREILQHTVVVACMAMLCSLSLLSHYLTSAHSRCSQTDLSIRCWYQQLAELYWNKVHSTPISLVLFLAAMMMLLTYRRLASGSQLRSNGLVVLAASLVAVVACRSHVDHTMAHVQSVLPVHLTQSGTKRELLQSTDIQLTEGVLSKSSCSSIIGAAEEYAGRHGGWNTARHASHPTTDLPLHVLPSAVQQLVSEVFTSRITNEFSQQYSSRLGWGTMVLPTDFFVVKYSREGQVSAPSGGHVQYLCVAAQAWHPPRPRSLVICYFAQPIWRGFRRWCISSVACFYSPAAVQEVALGTILRLQHGVAQTAAANRGKRSHQHSL